jgi:DnaK suppressor protein
MAAQPTDHGCFQFVLCHFYDMEKRIRRKPARAGGKNNRPKNRVTRSTRPKKQITKNSRNIRRAAASQDVLGSPRPEPKVPPRWNKYYKMLAGLRQDFLSRKDSLVNDAKEEQPAFSLHMADAGTDNYDRDFALSMISTEQNALYEIEEAMNRIRNGTYGLCEVTGKKIDRARLDVLPWTRFSAEAEKQLEKEGAVQRTRLGRREEVPKNPSDQQVAEETSSE